MLNPIASLHHLPVMHVGPGSTTTPPAPGASFEDALQDVTGAGASSGHGLQIMQVGGSNGSGTGNPSILPVTPHPGSPGTTMPNNLQIMQVGGSNGSGTGNPSILPVTPHPGSPGTTIPNNLQIMQVGGSNGTSVPNSSTWQIMQQHGFQGPSTTDANAMPVMKQHPSHGTISAHALAIMMERGSEGKKFPSPNSLQSLSQSAPARSTTDVNA